MVSDLGLILFPRHPKEKLYINGNEEQQPFAKEEILVASKRLRTGKAPGLDVLLSEVVRITATIRPRVYLDVFNRLLEEAAFPIV